MINFYKNKFCSALTVALLSISSPLALTSKSWDKEASGGNITPLISQLNHENVQKHLNAIDALSKDPSPEDIRTLTAVLKDKNQNTEVRRSAADALGGIGTGAKGSISDLTEVLKEKDSDKELRRSVAINIRRIDANPAVQDLIVALDDEDYGVRRYAAEALGSIGKEAKDAVPKLAKLLTKDPNSSVRGSAAEALGNIAPNDKTLVPVLNEALTDPAWFVRKGAAVALGNIGADAKEAVPNLHKALKDQNRTLRTWAAIALGNIGTAAKEAVPDLRNALNDENIAVSGNAAEALGNIGLDEQTAEENRNTIKKLIETLGRSDPYVRSQAVAALRKIAGNLQEKVKANQYDLALAITDLKDLKAALEKIKDSDLQSKKQDITDVNVHLQSLEAIKRGLFINENLNKPWVWGVVIYLILLFGIFGFRPLWLLKIDNFLKPISFKVPVLDIEISLPFVLLTLKNHPRVLDAWVAVHLKSVREVFQEKDTVRDRKIHISIPVILNGRTVAQLTGKDLRSIFKKHLLIWGEGGSGKTSLACQIARWAMSDDEAERLCEHPMLPVIIEEELNIEPASGKHP